MKVVLSFIIFSVLLSVTPTNADSASPQFYWYGTTSSANLETIRKNLSSSDIVVAKESSQRRFWKPWVVDTAISYVFRSVTSPLPQELDELGFKPLTKVRVTGSFARVSDINGWGTGVNGEVRRRSTFNDDYEMNPANERLIKESLYSPFSHLENASLSDFKNIFDVDGSIVFERAYYVYANITLSTVDAYTGETIEVINGSTQTPLFRAGYVPKAADLTDCSTTLSLL